MNIQKEIINITSEYFEDKIDYLKLSNASKAYKKILEELCGQNLNIDEGRADIAHENGKALSTYFAAMCLDDILRTRQFIRGIDKAIKAKLSDKPIHVLYAGTGPFATLILPFLFRHNKATIKYTLLEVNPFTFGALQDVLSKLGVEDYDITLVNEDATKYKVDTANEPDIIISETMQNALAKEQQVPIFLNLMKQVQSECIFIPEKIEIHLGLGKFNNEVENGVRLQHKKIEKVFEVSKAATFSSDDDNFTLLEDQNFIKRKTVIKNDEVVKFNQVLFITEIDVFDNEKISINDSGLTTPIILEDIPHDLKNDITVNTQYIITSEPTLEYTLEY